MIEGKYYPIILASSAELASPRALQENECRIHFFLPLICIREFLIWIDKSEKLHGIVRRKKREYHFYSRDFGKTKLQTFLQCSSWLQPEHPEEQRLSIGYARKQMLAIHY